ncbi:MAG: pyrroline-5-carboxylate reductase [Deltaproteobacteria bacterium]|nr:pyrroline-5-carboxylate reductase [Deltaproteobacteria bacterium]
MKDSRVTCIGSGNMGQALLQGLIRSGRLRPARITATDHRADRLREIAAALGVRTARDNAEACRKADLVILAVKPQILDRVLAEIAPALQPGTLLISIAAGFSTALIERLLAGEGPARPRVVRAMPNIAATVRAAATAICPGHFARRADLALARRLFETCGTVTLVDESLMDAVTGLSGTGPMYVFIIIEALSDAGVKVGLGRQQATQLAIQTVVGAAQMVQQTGSHPIFLKDLVTSPGGTAINALYSMEKTGLRAVLMDAVEAATRRSRELGEPYE